MVGIRKGCRMVEGECQMVEDGGKAAEGGERVEEGRWMEGGWKGRGVGRWGGEKGVG